MSDDTLRNGSLASQITLLSNKLESTQMVMTKLVCDMESFRAEQLRMAEDLIRLESSLVQKVDMDTLLTTISKKEDKTRGDSQHMLELEIKRIDDQLQDVSKNLEQKAKDDSQKVTANLEPTEKTGAADHPTHQQEEDATKAEQEPDGETLTPEEADEERKKKTQADLEIGQESAKEAVEVESYRNYIFQESVYDATFFVFWRLAGKISSLLVCAAFFLNLALQVGVILVLRENFTADTLPTEYVDKMRQWRASEGHSYRNADMLTGVSLVSRVCAMDGALSISDSQLSIRVDASNYLHKNQGMILCLIAIVLWSLICALECRRSLEFVVALFHLPRSTGGSDIGAYADGFRVLSVGLHRLLLGGSVALCRSVIAILLLLYGSWWLANTTSIKDLLLNSSALGFVLDIDEILVQFLSPSSYLGLIDAMQPLILPKYEIEIPSALVVGITGFVIVVDVVLVGHTRTQLASLQDVMCAESTDLDFITGTTETGFMVYANSVPYDEGMTEAVKAKQAATQLLVDHAPDVHRFASNVSRGYREQNLALLVRETAMPAEDFVNMQPCEDETDSKIGGHLWVATGVAAVKSVTTCAELSSYCRGAAESPLAKNVRSMCPITCGCADPLSGLWHLAGAQSGCPWSDCRHKIFLNVREYNGIRYKCEDTPVTELQSGPSWSFMLNAMRLTGIIGEIVFNNMSSRGCTAIQNLPHMNRRVVCGTYDIFSDDKGFLGAGVMCPESCGCIYPYSEQNPDVPEGVKAYTPGDKGLCPMRSCGDKFWCDNFGIC